MKILLGLSYFLLICISFQSNSAQTESSDNQILTAKNTTDLESEAKFLGNQWSGENLRRSIILFNELSLRSQKAGDFQKSAEFLRASAQISFLLEDYDEALLKLDKSLGFERNASNNVGIVESDSLLSLTYLQKGQIDVSEKYLNDGLKLNDLIKDTNAKASLYFSAAELKYTQHKLDQSIEFAAQAATLWQNVGNPKREADALRTLSFAYTGKEDFLTAQTKLTEALERSQAADDKRGEALAQFQMAYFHLIFNEPQKSLEICNFSAAQFPDDMDFIQKARLFNGISTIYEIYGDWKSAFVSRQKTLELFRKGNYPNGELATLPSLIDVSLRIGDETSAFQYFQEAKELSGKLKDEFYLANANLYVADFYSKNNSDKKAVGYYEIALKHLTKLKYSDGISLIDNNLGEIFLRRKQFSTARKYFDLSLEISRKSLNKFAEAQTLYNLAKLDSFENNVSEALKSAEESIKITEYLSSQTVNSKLKSIYFSNVFDRYEVFVNLLMKMHRQSLDNNFNLQALQAAEKARARSMLENLSLSETDLTRDADSELAKREKEIRVLLNAKADKLTDLLSNDAAKSEIDKLDGEINELNNEHENIKADLKQKSPVYSAIRNPAPFDVGEFQRDILDDDTLLLEFSFGTQESYLWLVGKSAVISYVLPPREQIETHIKNLRELLSSREIKPDEEIEVYQQRVAEAEAAYQIESNELSRELFGQITDKLSGKRLIIVPDGKLNYFPVAALPFPDSSDNQPILLTNETIYEPSAQTLLLLEKSRRQSVATKNLLVFSDPVFTDDDARFAPANKPADTAETASTDKFRFVESLDSLVRLTASKDESDSIINIVGASESDVYSGFAANREQLLNVKAEDYKILHFATHGFTNEERPELSGIILSRFNEKGEKLDESFRIHDIYGLNLNADLVVLSACETGLGKEVKGEGLMSLNNAFLQTGAKSVMASLWKVEDGATLVLMKNFYKEMESDKLTPSQALRQAQIKLRQNPQYKSPFYWAAFTVQGDFRNTPQISSNFVNKFYFFALIPLTIIVFYVWRRKNFPDNYAKH